MPMVISSPALRDRKPIPRKYTCEAEDRSPPLYFGNPPPGTESLALVVVDPDAPDPKAPKTTFTHWVVYNLPAEVRSLEEGVTADALPGGARQGTNDFGRAGYGGPCPPIGEHRYFFKLYALDRMLPELGAPRRAQLESAMRGHVLAETELMGTYRKH